MSCILPEGALPINHSTHGLLPQAQVMIGLKMRLSICKADSLVTPCNGSAHLRCFVLEIVHPTRILSGAGL